MDIDLNRGLESSDEMEYLEHNDSHNVMSDEFIADMKRHYDDNYSEFKRQDYDQPMPHSSHQTTLPHDYVDDRIEKLIQDAEANQSKIYGTPGKSLSDNLKGFELDLDKNFVHSAMVDETYMLVASHLGEGLVRKIENGEFVDFSKLIPWDRIVAESEEMELKLVMREGKTYYVPTRENSVISGFRKWEQAFRVYSNIYTRKHPTQASELIQYNHVIHTASLT